MHKLTHLAALAGMGAAMAFAAPLQAAEPVTLNDLSANRALELRCTMVAGLIVSEHARGVRKDNRGLDGAQVQRLGDALAAALAADHGADAAHTRSLLKEDFEYFARTLAEDDVKEAARVLDELSATCRPIWDGERPIIPAPRAAAVAVPDADPPRCFALMASIAEAIRQSAKGDTAESMAFARMANRIEASWLVGGGDLAALGSARDQFDADAFDALAEPEAEAIITGCQTLAGPDL